MLVSVSFLALFVVSQPTTSTSTSTSRVLVLDVKASSMDAASVTAFTKLVTHELAIALAPMSVVDVHEVARLADLEADRQDAGCTTTSCLAEVAAAYGAELVLFGEEALLGDKHIVTLQIFDAKRAEARGRTLITVSHVGDLPEHVPSAVRELVATLPNATLTETLTAKRTPSAASARPDTDFDVATPASADDAGSGAGSADSNPLATAGYVTAGAVAGFGAILLLSSAVVLTTPTDPDSGALGFGLFGAGAGLVLVGAPLIAGGTWLLCDNSQASPASQARENQP